MRVFSLAALELLETLKERGARLSLDGDNIVVKGYLTDDLRDQIREQKQGLIELMQDGEHLWQKVSEWNFEPVDIPRLDGKGIDVWMVGRREDKPGDFRFWFVETKDEDRETTVEKKAAAVR